AWVCERFPAPSRLLFNRAFDASIEGVRVVGHADVAVAHEDGSWTIVDLKYVANRAPPVAAICARQAAEIARAASHVTGGAPPDVLMVVVDDDGARELPF
ncbi:hypothetical protein HOK31_27870, partial [Candidatus Poribacteria bacterium]|nr:hypothetical protein [Candidatus Poribacteria bacterium]